jgi:hypothetical protein
MGFRRRISNLRKLRYHTLYGSVENPPFADMGVHGKAWPNGSMITSTQLSTAKHETIVLGWVCDQIGLDTAGIWVCTLKAVPLGFRFPHSPPPKIKSKAFKLMDTTRVVAGTYKFVCCVNINEFNHLKRISKLITAYEKLHDVIMD